MPDAPIAAGIIFVAPDGDILLLRRSDSEKTWPGHWNLPGGKADDGESPDKAAEREAREEIGSSPGGDKKLFDERLTPRGMVFHTFVKPVEEPFTPVLNGEHSGFMWAGLHQLPEPLHPALATVLREKLGDESSKEARQAFAAWCREEPVAMDGKTVAFDRASVRSYDQDGHLRVEMANISKANICPYYGREIPGCDELGLDPNKFYRLYRDPEELAKAAPSFAGKPLLLIHTPVNADNHPRQVTVGSVGDDVRFEAPYLRSPLSVWDGEAIELIETDRQKELSSSYRYRADMTPGDVNGEAYDGVMRDIVANHVALVREGRAGPDVVVGDSALQPGSAEPEVKVGDSNMRIIMSKTTKLSRMAGVAHGAIVAFLQPRLAADAKVDITPALDGVTGKTFKTKHADIIGAVTKAAEGKLAKDQKLDGLDKMLLALDEHCDPEAMDEEDDNDKKKAEDEETDEERREREAKEKAAKDAEEEGKVDKKAMDAAIKLASDEAVERTKREMLKTQRDIREAERFVRPWVGDLAVACDSADDVYKAALEARGKKTDGIHPSAYRSILEMMPKPGDQRQQNNRVVAMDAAQHKSFAERFPEAARVGRA